MWANRSGRSPKLSNVSESLRSLTKIERSWAICSGQSPKMSDHERIAQVANQNWANEWIACFFKRIACSLIFSQKTSDSLRKPMSEFPALPIMQILSFFHLQYANFSILQPLLCKFFHSATPITVYKLFHSAAPIMFFQPFIYLINDMKNLIMLWKFNKCYVPLLCKFFYSATPIIQMLSFCHPNYSNAFILSPQTYKCFLSDTPNMQIVLSKLFVLHSNNLK